MAKNKFDILNDEETNEVVEAAALKENKIEPKKAEVTNINLTALSVDLLDALKENKRTGTGESVVGFIKRATRRLAKEEGII